MSLARSGLASARSSIATNGLAQGAAVTAAGASCPIGAVVSAFTAPSRLDTVLDVGIGVGVLTLAGASAYDRYAAGDDGLEPLPPLSGAGDRLGS